MFHLKHVLRKVLHAYLLIRFVFLIKQIIVGRKVVNRLKDVGNEEDKES